MHKELPQDHERATVGARPAVASENPNCRDAGLQGGNGRVVPCGAGSCSHQQNGCTFSGDQWKID